MLGVQTARTGTWFLVQIVLLTLTLLVIFSTMLVILGFALLFGTITSLRKTTTDIGDVDLSQCVPGQVLRFNGTHFRCDNAVTSLGDLKDVNTGPNISNHQCLCFFNDTAWRPQGPFLEKADIPIFEDGITVECEDLPPNQEGTPLCNALRWGTPNGTWDAFSNTPFLSTGTCSFGDFYVVTVAGATPLDGEFPWDVGDALACSATGWKRIGSDILVDSVNGMTGEVVLGLGDMTDVDLTGQMNNDLLQRVGGIWTPQPMDLSINDLTDVFTEFASDGDALVFDGVTWQPNSLCCGTGDMAQGFGARARVTLFQSIPNSIASFTTIIFGTELDDPDNNYNQATGVYTAPFTGYYGAWADVTWIEPINPVVDWTVRIRLTVNGNPINTISEFIGTTTGLFNPPLFTTTPVTVAGFFRMNAGDSLRVQAGQTNFGGVSTNLDGLILTPTVMTVVFQGPL